MLTRARKARIIFSNQCHKEDHEQAAAVGIALLTDDELTVANKPSSLSLGTPKFIRVSAELRRTTQLYST